MTAALAGKRVLINPKNGTGGALGEHSDGGLCEFIAFHTETMIPLPDEITFEQVAALPIASGTTQRMMVTCVQAKS